MNILVIGNGFDLAHDLKTTYKDFLEYWITRNRKRFPMSINYGTTFIDNIWLKHFIIRSQKLGNTWIDLEKEIYNVIETVSKVLYELSNGEIDRIFPIMLSIQKDVDFDFNNISDYIETAYINYKTNDEKYVNVQTNDFSKLYTYITSYHGFVKFLYDKLRDFTKEFENYLINEVCTEKKAEGPCSLDLETIGAQAHFQDFYILNFNYTDICEKLYTQNFSIVNATMKPVYIHGKINNNETCNLILGTHSFSNVYKSKAVNYTIPVYFNVFKKHNQRHKYDTIRTYQNLVNSLNQPDIAIKPVFHVVGHSLDKTDHNILKHIFLANKNAVINIYYHNEEAQERLINNINEIIGEAEVMTRVRFIYQHDEKRGILRLKAKSLSSNM